MSFSHTDPSAPEIEESNWGKPCPECESTDTNRAHKDACPTHDECTYWSCDTCNHTWDIQ